MKDFWAGMERSNHASGHLSIAGSALLLTDRFCFTSGKEESVGISRIESMPYRLLGLP